MPKYNAPDKVIEALERFNVAAEAEYENRAASLDDLKFSVGEQWDTSIRTLRTQQNKPSFTMDQTQQSIRLVCNQYRQQPPSIQVNPIGDGADKDTADIIQGIFRHIEVNSDAQVTYEKKHEGTVRKGFASCRLNTEYVDDDSDEQELVIENIPNDFAVFWQPGVEQEKARWCFLVADYPKDNYREEFADSALAKMSDSEYSAFTATGNAQWLAKDSIRVAEYFEVIEEKVPGKKRPVKKVLWRKINALEILEEKNLPGTSIPVFTAYGDNLDVDGKPFIAGLVRNAKEPQRMVNYSYSKVVEAIALAPTAPWVMATGQIPAGQEKQWENANASGVQVLYYNQVDSGNKPAPPPERNSIEPPIQAIASLLAESKMNVKAAMGIYDPSLGQRKGDESGSAIEKLQAQGSIATMNYADNMGRMIRRLARVTLEWIRVIYDVPRVQRIINPDGSATQVVIHNGEAQQDQAKQLAEQEEIKKIYDIGVGRYDIAFSVGPSYQSKRQEAVSTQLELLKNMPKEVAPVFLDLLIRNMDIPQSDQIADRAKKMLPPQLQDSEDGADPQMQLQNVQAQLQQLSQQHQQLTQALNQANEVINTKQVEQQGKIHIAQIQEQSAQAIEKMKLEAQITIAEIGTKAQDMQQRLQTLEDTWAELHGSAHELAMQQAQHEHEKTQAAEAAANAQQTQAQDQQHETEMAVQTQGAEE